MLSLLYRVLNLEFIFSFSFGTTIEEEEEEEQEDRCDDCRLIDDCEKKKKATNPMRTVFF